MFTDLLIDALLVAGFGVQHSLFATLRAKKVVKSLSRLDPLSWRAPQSFINVLYVVLAACLWRHVGYVVWDLKPPFSWAMTAVLVAGWLWYFQIHIFEYDCGLAFGSSGIINRALGRKSPPLEMWKVGMRRWVRFPVHTAFFPMFLAFPHMTADLLVFGIVANVYNWIGTELYDLRLKTLIKEPYLEYVRRTGLIFPPVVRHPEGAADLQLPAPAHWRRPATNLPGILLGLLGGLFFWQILGVAHLTPHDIWLAWGTSFLLAFAGGAVLGMVNLPKLPAANGVSFDSFMTSMATNSALISAIAIITWFAVSLVRTGTHPTLAVVLPMWLTVLWIGHTAGMATVLLPNRLATPSATPSGS